MCPVEIIKEDRIKKLVENCLEHICLVCGSFFDECGCYYDLGEAYIEEIDKLLKKIE